MSAQGPARATTPDKTSLVCTKCRETKPATSEYFHPRIEKRNGFTSWCRDCNRARARATQAARRADPERRIVLLEEKSRYFRSPKGREWKRAASSVDNHKRRSRMAATEYFWTVELWRQCQADWGGVCAYCGVGGDLWQDHVIPLSAPGCSGTTPWNIVPACPDCNLRKGSLLLADWLGESHPAVQRVTDYTDSMLVRWRPGVSGGATIRLTDWRKEMQRV